MPTNQPDQVYATFFADDDDGDLTNGTPNFGAYCAAALHHGYECPEIITGISIAHEPLGDTDDSEHPYGVSAAVSSDNGELADGGVQIHWRFDGGPWSASPMAPSGMGGDGYAGVIPAQDMGRVEYYLSAEDVSGAVATLPQGAPLAYFGFDVAWLVDAVETGGGWTAGHPNDTATGGVWEHVDPVGTIAQPENDHSNQGNMCWVTGQHTPGDPANADDVDGGNTTLTTAVYDLSMASAASIRFWYWYSNDQGSNPGTDFAQFMLSNNGGLSYSIVGSIIHSTDGWESRTLDLLDHFDELGQVSLRIVAGDVGSDALVEMAVDDLTILAEIGGTGVGDGFSVSFPAALEQNVPNPFNPLTEIRFSLAQSGPASLAIYDAGGRLVKELARGSFPAGDHRLLWDGSDAQGRLVASGVYVYRLDAAGTLFSRTMVLIK
jgi:hypothetical protein